MVVSLESDPRWPESVLVRLILTPQGKVKKLDLLPVELNAQGDPHFASSAMTDRIIDRMQTLSTPLGTKVTRRSWYASVDVN